MNTQVMPIRFRQWNCMVALSRYINNGRIAISLLDADNDDEFDSIIVVASINIIHETIAFDEVCIKDYSENEGILKCLINAEIISKPVRFVSTGFVTRVPVCKLLIPLPK